MLEESLLCLSRRSLPIFLVRYLTYSDLFLGILCALLILILCLLCVLQIPFSVCFFLSLDFGYEAFFHMEVLDFNMVKIIQVFFPVCTFHILFKKSFPTMFWFKTSLYYL